MRIKETRMFDGSIFFFEFYFCKVGFICIKPKLKFVRWFVKLYRRIMIAFKILGFFAVDSKLYFGRETYARQYIFHDTWCHMVLDSHGRKNSNNRKCFIPKARRHRGVFTLERTLFGQFTPTGFCEDRNCLLQNLKLTL